MTKPLSSLIEISQKVEQFSIAKRSFFKIIDDDI